MTVFPLSSFPQSSQNPVQIGLVGFGLFGKCHARAITSTPGATLAAIAVKSEASRQAAAEAYPDAAIYGDYREMLARADIELVDVTAPNFLHHEIGMATIGAGKHLLLEKPMANSIADCDDLNQAAGQSGKLLAIGHELRLSSLWGEIRSLIDAGRIGRPQHTVIELSRFPYRQGAEGWRYDLERVGSWILEEPIHFFDLARWYLEPCGEPMSVYARANSRHPDHPELRDNFSAMVNFPDGGYAVVTQTLAAFGHHQSAKIVGTEGTIWAHWSAADARSDESLFGLTYGLGDQVTQVNLASRPGELLELAEEIAAVAECVRTGSPPPCTGEDGRWSSLLCLAAEQSVDSGQVVDIDQFCKGCSD